MSQETGKSPVLTMGPWVGIVLGLLVFMTSCSSGKKWMDVQSFSTKDKTIAASQRFRIEPVEEGKTLIKNTGAWFEATFTCTRQEGDEVVSYRTRSHYESRKSGKGGLAVDQTMNSMALNHWPAGIKVQEIKIKCPFFPWEIKSDRRGDVYFYLIDAEDGTCMSNIVMIPVKIKAGGK